MIYIMHRSIMVIDHWVVLMDYWTMVIRDWAWNNILNVIVIMVVGVIDIHMLTLHKLRINYHSFLMVSTSFNSSIIPFSALIFRTWMIISGMWVILFVILHLLLLICLVLLISSLWFINTLMFVLELVCHLFLLLLSIFVPGVSCLIWLFIMFLCWLAGGQHRIRIYRDILWMSHTMT